MTASSLRGGADAFNSEKGSFVANGSEKRGDRFWTFPRFRGSGWGNHAQSISSNWGSNGSKTLVDPSNSTSPIGIPLFSRFDSVETELYRVSEYGLHD